MGCSGCLGCSGIQDKNAEKKIGYLSATLIATQEQAIKNIDKVREIVLANQARLEMGHWHQNDDWRNHPVEKEITQCQTTHCMSGWLQVTSDVPEIRNATDPQKAGFFAAPIAAGMFFQPAARVLKWLENREYDKS